MRPLLRKRYLRAQNGISVEGLKTQPLSRKRDLGPENKPLSRKRYLRVQNGIPGQRLKTQPLLRKRDLGPENATPVEETISACSEWDPCRGRENVIPGKET